MKPYEEYCLRKYNMEIIEFLDQQAKHGNSVTEAAKLLPAPVASIKKIAKNNNIYF